MSGEDGAFFVRSSLRLLYYKVGDLCSPEKRRRRWAANGLVMGIILVTKERETQ